MGEGAFKYYHHLEMLLFKMSQFSSLKKETRTKIEKFLFETIKQRGMISNLELQNLLSENIKNRTGCTIYLTRMQIAAILRIFKPLIISKRIRKQGRDRIYYIYLGK